MKIVFNDLRVKFDKIVELDSKLSENHALKKGVRKTIQKVTLDQFFLPAAKMCARQSKRKLWSKSSQE